MNEQLINFWCNVYLQSLSKGSAQPAAWADTALADFEDRFINKKPAKETEAPHEN
jgi:hypothetical protein